MDHVKITDDQLRDLKKWLPAKVLQEIAVSTDSNIIDEYLRPGGLRPRDFQAERLLLAYRCFIRIRDAHNDPKAARAWFTTPGMVKGGLTPAQALHKGNIADVEEAAKQMASKNR